MSGSDTDQGTPSGQQAKGSADPDMAATAPETQNSPPHSPANAYNEESNLQSPVEPISPPSARVQAMAIQMNHDVLPETQAEEAILEVLADAAMNSFDLPILAQATTAPEGTTAPEPAMT